MLASVIFYHFFYFNNVFPISDGWGVYYSELLERGAVPYRDFYYYLMPLNLGIDFVFWKLSFGSLFVFRLWYFVERTAMIFTLYKLLCKFVSPIFSAIGCICGLFIGFGHIYDLVGDYNQTEVFLVILLTYALVKFFENLNSEKKHSKYGFLALAGAFLGLIILLKQSTAFAASLICLVFLISYCAICKDGNRLKYVGAAFIGVFVPIAICFSALAASGALKPFFQQVIGVGGAKDGILAIISDIFDKIFGETVIIITALLFVIFAVLFIDYSTRRKRSTLLALLLSTVACIYAIYLLNGNIVEELYKAISYYPILCIIPICLFSASAFIIYRPKAKISALLRLCDCVPVCLGAVSLVFTVSLLMAKKFSWELLRIGKPSFAAVLYIAGVSMIVAPIWWFYCRAKGKEDAFDIRKLPLFVGGAILYYACSMSTLASSTVTPRYMVVAGSVLIAFVMEYSKLPEKMLAIKNTAIMILCCYISFCFFAQKASYPYAWWGTRSEPYENRNQTVDVPALRGFRLTESQKHLYEDVTRVIIENSDEGDCVWGFPHVKIFNILADRYDLSDPVPVLFYDVCSSSAAKRELEWLEANPPEIIVWCDIPGCLETHEGAGLDMSEHRRIIDWFYRARTDSYTVLDSYENVTVYKLIKET